MIEKLTLNSRGWFENTYFKGKDQLSASSNIKLKVTAIFYPLPFLVEAFFFIGLLFMAVFPFINKSLLLFQFEPITFFWVYLPTVPCYILLRYILIKLYYRLDSKLHCVINKDNIEIPTNRIIDEPNGQLVLAKEEIKNIKIHYFSSTNDRKSSYRACEFLITTKLGKSIKLKLDYFPLQQMLYLLIYFDYPLNYEKKYFAILGLIRVLCIILPVVAHTAVTGLLFKEYLF